MGRPAREGLVREPGGSGGKSEPAVLGFPDIPGLHTEGGKTSIFQRVGSGNMLPKAGPD